MPARNATINFFSNIIPDFFVNTVWNRVLSQKLTTSTNFLLTGSSLSMGAGNGSKIRFGNLLVTSSSSKVKKFQKVMGIIGAIAAGVAMVASIVTLIFPMSAPVTVWIIKIGVIVAVVCLNLAGIKVELEAF